MEKPDPKDARDVNMSRAAGPTAFNLAVRKDGTGGGLTAEVELTPADAAFPPRLDRVELVATRRTLQPKPARSDSAPTRDLTLRRATAQGDRLRAELALAIDDAPGTYQYFVELRTAQINGFGVPAFVRALSTDDPTPTKDPHKTLNLEKFVTDLRQAASSVHAPVLAAWTMTVVRR